MKPHHKTHTPELVAKIVRLKQEGLSYSEIGERMRMSSSSISHALAKAKKEMAVAK